MKYALYIKSHTDYPDLEFEVDAATPEEALYDFQKGGLWDWDEDILKENMAEITSDGAIKEIVWA